jgi:hypothetical protein
MNIKKLVTFLRDPPHFFLFSYRKMSSKKVIFICRQHNLGNRYIAFQQSNKEEKKTYSRIDNRICKPKRIKHGHLKVFKYQKRKQT